MGRTRKPFAHINHDWTDRLSLNTNIYAAIRIRAVIDVLIITIIVCNILCICFGLVRHCSSSISFGQFELLFVESAADIAVPLPAWFSYRPCLRFRLLFVAPAL